MQGNDPGIGDPIFDLVQSLLIYGFLAWMSIRILIGWVVYIIEKIRGT